MMCDYGQEKMIENPNIHFLILLKTAEERNLSFS